MTARQGHHCFYFWAHQRAAEDGHSALAVDHGGDAEFFIDVTGRAETFDGRFRVFGGIGRSGRCRRGEERSFPDNGGGERGECAQKGSAIPAIAKTHIVQPFLAVFTTAAVQLISTSDWPGSAATATQVRAGPPFGK